jgi:hypothetical protein
MTTTAARTRAAAGIRPRCGEYGDSYLWLSDHERDRQQAARLCAGCVVITECREVGRHQRFGVFGGRDTTVTAGRKLQRDTEAA